MTDLIDTTEMYLRTILDLEEENIVPLRARISERLGHSGPDGLADHRPHGARRARRRRGRPPPRADPRRAHARRCTSCASTGSPSACSPTSSASTGRYVHDEACRWEHVMSEQVERRLLELLDHPTRVAVRQPDPRARGARRCRPPSRSWTASSDIVDARRRERRAGARRRPPPRRARAVRARAARPAASTPASCPGATAPRSARAGRYVLVQVDGVDGGLELPSEVAGHIFVGE